MQMVRGWQWLLAGTLFLVAALGFQILNLAYESEFARQYDEAAHYVTGLMVYDFVKSLDWGAPLSFAENYYFHYPKVAIGHWPPVFYLIQAAWNLLLTPSRGSAMLMMVALATFLSLILWSSLKETFGPWWSLGAGLFLLSLPLTQELSSTVMAEIPLAIFALLAVLCLANYMKTPSWRGSLSFAGFAALAIMVKANGLALALVPLLAIPLSGKLEPWRQRSLWLSAVPIAAICGPWYYLTLAMLKNGPLESSPTLAYTQAAIPRFSLRLYESLGLLPFALMIVGLVTQMLAIRRRPAQNSDRWTAMASLLLATLLFHWIVPASFEQRHVFLALPVAIPFILFGVWQVADRLDFLGFSPAQRRAVVALIAVAAFALSTFEIPLDRWQGFGAVAAELTDDEELSRSIILVSSDAVGEGSLVAEIALREERPDHVVLRASKVLSQSLWTGEAYRQLFLSVDDLWEFLDQVPIGVVVLDRSVPDKLVTPDQALLASTLEETRSRWRLLGSHSVTRDGRHYPDRLLVYLLEGHQDRPPRPITLDLQHMLGRSIRLTPGAPPSSE